MLLWLLRLAVEPGNGLDLPPADDPMGRIIAFAIAIAVPASAIVVAKISAKKSPSNGPTAATASESSTPRLDVGQQFLERFVASLEDRIRLTEAKNEDLERRYLELLEKYATVSAKYEGLRVEAEDMRDELNVLRGRLQGPGHG